MHTVYGMQALNLKISMKDRSVYSPICHIKCFESFQKKLGFHLQMESQISKVSMGFNPKVGPLGLG